MRTAFIQALTRLAAGDDRIVLLTADLGYQVMEEFAESFPHRFFNVGVAEQNMLGLATGLAACGFVPYVYSIVPFAVIRPLEFIRMGALAHHLPVRIVGVGGGVAYGYNGLSHFGLEDLGIMRGQPGMTVLAPADGHQAEASLAATVDLPGPVYFRLGKDERDEVPGLHGRFTLGRAETVRSGNDVLLVSTGAIAKTATAVADRLSGEGIECTVMVASCLQPSPVEDLAMALGRFRLAFTVESHYVANGLGSLVAEVSAAHGFACRLIRCGIDALPIGEVGRQSFLEDRYGISEDKLVERVGAEFRRTPAS